MNTRFTYKLSVIIVNYNVSYFLDQCLSSVKRALEGISSEVLIVDNASKDDSLDMVRTHYPEFKLIANSENLGFSKANNQAIKLTQGEYVLLLNPDTVVAEDTFEKVIAFMDQHPDAGGLGVHMVDGLGTFLPESKRGLPRPLVAFYKIFGISKLFPKSKRFAQYHAGHISENDTSAIDVLSGAFMLLRKEALDNVGLLDEVFFMYGEDIDLSYRIQQGGYTNYYFPETSIIHYKGESTKKSSVNYVFVFYKAMVIFAKKHFIKNFVNGYALMIHLGIYFRAGLALLYRMVKGALLPAIDLLYIVLGLFAMTHYWQKANIEFPERLIQISIPLYALIWMLSVFINGGYDKQTKIFKYVKGIVFGTIALLVIYAMLPKGAQFSRLFIFLGSAWVLLYYLMSRIFLHYAIGKRFKLSGDKRKTYLILGSESEFQRVQTIIQESQGSIKEIKQVLPADLEQFQTLPEADELLFCPKDLTFKQIITAMRRYRREDLEFKIAPENRNFLIGSNSIDTAGELYILDINMLGSSENVRKKRLFDLSVSAGLLLALPFLLFTVNNKIQFTKNLVHVLLGRYSFIGFKEDAINRDIRLPKIKQGLLSPCDVLDATSSQLCDKLNLLYARDYSLRKDFKIVFKSWGKLDRKIG